MMEERKQNEKLVKVEMIELTEEEKECMKLLDEKLAEDIVVIDMSIDSPICDYFVIASASNERLLLALKDHIEDACDKERYYVKNIEGRKNCKWGETFRYSL